MLLFWKIKGKKQTGRAGRREWLFLLAESAGLERASAEAFSCNFCLDSRQKRRSSSRSYPSLEIQENGYSRDCHGALGGTSSSRHCQSPRCQGQEEFSAGLKNNSSSSLGKLGPEVGWYELSQGACLTLVPWVFILLCVLLSLLFSLSFLLWFAFLFLPSLLHILQGAWAWGEAEGKEEAFQ